MTIVYKLDDDKVVERDQDGSIAIEDTVLNVIEVLHNTIGIVMLPDDDSEQGFLANHPLARFYTRDEEIQDL